MTVSLDYLAIGAHPDDCEMLAGGFLLMMKKKNLRIGICDLTGGEAGSYGDKNKRSLELKKATNLLQLDVRITLDLTDSNLRNTLEARLKVIEVIRKHKPKIILTFGGKFIRHPDHVHAKRIVEEASYLAGLKNLPTENLQSQTLIKYAPYRPQALMQFHDFFSSELPSFIVDITEVWTQKLQLIEAYDSQVIPHDSQQKDGDTFIHSKAFWQMLESKAKWLGSLTSCQYAEGFVVNNIIRLDNPIENLMRKQR